VSALEARAEQARADQAALREKTERFKRGKQPQMVVRDGAFWILDNESLSYEGPFRSQFDVRVKLAELHPTLAWTHDQKPAQITKWLTPPITLRAARVDTDLTKSQTTFDVDTGTLTVGITPRYMAAQFDPAVDAWLRLLAGSDDGYRAIEQWLVSCQQRYLHRPAAGLVFIGDHSIGKGVFAHAVSEGLWGQPPVQFARVVHEFNSEVMRCPIWFDNEAKALGSGKVSSRELRDLVDARKIPYTRKHHDPEWLIGCGRLLVPVNATSDIRLRDIGSASVVDAVRERLTLLENRAADTTREALAKLDAPGCVAHADIDRIAGHMAWIQASVPLAERRFLGGTDDGAGGFRLALAQTVSAHAELFDRVRRALSEAEGEGPPHDGALRIADGRLYAYPAGLRDLLVEQGRGARVDLGQVQDALNAVRADKTARRTFRVSAGPRPFWELNVAALVEALELDADEVLRVLESRGQRR
jgi:hypothetical protein